MSRVARPLLLHCPGTAILRRLAPVLLFAWAGGCAWWPDIEERPEVMFGPAIDRSLVEPSPDGLVNLTTISTTFSVVGAVSDPDTPVESLFFQWYVGYPESDTPRSPDFIGYQSIRFNPCAFESELPPPFAGSPHVLELIVSDQPIEFDPEKGRIINGGYAYVSWTFVPQVACQ